ncbi:DUF423 domain-containing protein [Bremerella alba]|uniref:Uncharacterized protein n=1 Tax=Bremerella alba TaxID=980252 RepID=A0A7V8V698_9BACT|nr:DUF423 domain-containing protein [Bremerella alba]MBA2115739.1 hypothetical protein [Bremerella alba]
MAKYNLIAGALFGMVLVIGGPIGEPYAKIKFSDALKEKAVMVPGPLQANGTPGQPVMEISNVDRQESAERWQRYQDGLRYIAIHALALAVLGLSATAGWGQIMGGIGFTGGTLLFGCGTAIAALVDAPTFAIFASVGAMFLLLGWLGLLVSAISSSPLAKTAEV